MHPDPRKIAPVVVFLLLTAAAIYYLTTVSTTQAIGPLAASGTVESVEISLAPEINGRVLEVLVSEGEAVSAGDTLVRLDDSLLQAQLEQARAALSIAEANYDLVAAGQPAEQRDAAISVAEAELIAAEQALEAIHDNWPDQATRAQQALKDARQRQYNAERNLGYLTTSADQTDIDLAYTQLVLAQDALEKAEEAFEPYEDKPADNLVRAQLQAKVAAAQKAYDQAVTHYNNLTGTANEFDVSQSQAELAIANAQLENAQEDYDQLILGPDPDDLAMAEARIAAAEARLAAAQIETPTPEQLAVAQAQIASAQAAITTLETQIAKTIITAPSDGIVIERLAEPGELALPNATLLVLADLEHLTLTVYAPEDRYGEVTLGQAVSVTVDSFPGETFTATVTHIADEAEFTPRNVQTAEGRKTTVFAVKLTVDDASGKLKPGMPADVVFGEE
ncbi:MAG: efflux RND transporter periplasmic adaptor subunit [Anaerolineales bacterium]|nr:efflux RND transporter periplasmic adaptor subunit [Anaerolineales bacterium]